MKKNLTEAGFYEKEIDDILVQHDEGDDEVMRESEWLTARFVEEALSILTIRKAITLKFLEGDKYETLGFVFPILHTSLVQLEKLEAKWKTEVIAARNDRD